VRKISFRDQLIAATLKRENAAGTLAIAPTFRDQLIAATLKPSRRRL